MSPADVHGPFPFGAVRDLLGIARALYRAERARNSQPDHLERVAALEAIGRELRLSLELAARGGSGSLGTRAAWRRAERATLALGELASDARLLGPAIAATAARLRRRG